MNTLITILVPLFCFTFVIIYVLLNQRFEKERFREFVKAIKSKTLEDYNEAVEELPELEEKEEDELVDLDSVEEEQLIKSLNKTHEHIKG